MEFNNHQRGAPSRQPMSLDKPSRRRWTDGEKRSILDECKQPKMSVSAVSKKYGIPTNQLFQWRRQFEIGIVARQDGGTDTPLSECRDILSRIAQLKRIANMITSQLAEEIRRNQISAYNASIALSNLTTGLSKLSALAFELFDRFDRIEPESSSTADNDNGSGSTLEEEREAEALCMELIRDKLRRDKELKVATGAKHVQN